MATTAKLEEVELGFLEKCDDPEQLASTSFPSKVGGKPLWLDPVLLPPPERLVCGECLQPCVLLLQIYAPLSDDPSCYHRNVYVFMCRSSTCHKRGSSKPFRVFRCSLPRVNDYYKEEEEDEEKDDDDDGLGETSSGARNAHCLISSAGNNSSTVAVSTTCRTDHTPTTITKGHAPTTTLVPPTCLVCGCLGPMHCGRCKVVHYCSRHHQKWDWKAGHKLLCDDLAKGERKVEEVGYQPGGGLLLPVFEIVTETEPEEEGEEEEEDRSEEERCVLSYLYISMFMNA